MYFSHDYRHCFYSAVLLLTVLASSMLPACSTGKRQSGGIVPASPPDINYMGRIHWDEDTFRFDIEELIPFLRSLSGRR